MMRWVVVVVVGGGRGRGRGNDGWWRWRLNQPSLASPVKAAASAPTKARDVAHRPERAWSVVGMVQSVGSAREDVVK